MRLLPSWRQQEICFFSGGPGDVAATHVACRTLGCRKARLKWGAKPARPGLWRPHHCAGHWARAHTSVGPPLLVRKKNAGPARSREPMGGMGGERAPGGGKRGGTGAGRESVRLRAAHLDSASSGPHQAWVRGPWLPPGCGQCDNGVADAHSPSLSPSIFRTNMEQQPRASGRFSFLFRSLGRHHQAGHTHTHDTHARTHHGRPGPRQAPPLHARQEHAQ